MYNSHLITSRDYSLLFYKMVNIIFKRCKKLFSFTYIGILKYKVTLQNSVTIFLSLVNRIRRQSPEFQNCRGDTVILIYKLDKLHSTRSQGCWVWVAILHVMILNKSVNSWISEPPQRMKSVKSGHFEYSFQLCYSIMPWNQSNRFQAVWGQGF